jgi:outer membrane protein assembly factor BamB
MRIGYRLRGVLRRVLLCGTAALIAPFAVASSAAAKPGDIIVGTDGDDDSLVRIDPTTGAVRDVATISDGLAGMDFAGNGSLYVGEYFDGNIYRVNPRTGAFASFLSDPPVTSIYDVDRGPGGFMYAADNGTTGGAGALLRFSPRRGYPVALQSEGDYANLSAIAIRFSDETVFSTSYEGRVMSYNLRTGAHRLILSDPTLTSPEGIALTPDGRLYVSGGDVDATIYRMNVRTGALTPVASGGLLDSGGVDCNYELGVDLSGNLLSAVLC